MEFLGSYREGHSTINTNKNANKEASESSHGQNRVNAVHASGSREDIKPIDDPISFPLVNPSRVIMPHYDALVLTLCINGFDVHRVLVDLGSAVDLLQLPAFNQMKLSPQMLNSARRILSGFNGVTTTKLGDITLLVQAGPVTQHVLFLVVEDLGPYNCIVGKAWLHLMKGVPSTYHQMVNYLTSAGQVDLQSNQLAAQQCYQLSMWEQREEKVSDGHPLQGHILA